MDHEDTNAMLDSLPVGVWSNGPTDVGFCSTAQPVTFIVTQGTPGWTPQYLTKPEGQQRITETLEELIQAQVLHKYLTANGIFLFYQQKRRGLERIVKNLKCLKFLFTSSFHRGKCSFVIHSQKDMDQSCSYVRYVEKRARHTIDSSLGLEAIVPSKIFEGMNFP